jgi:hypothetical protein
LRLEVWTMPEKQTIKRAKKDLRQGKSASTAGGEFVREEIHHVREGKHGARSTKQAIAIGLSKARRAGVPVPPRGRSASAARKRTASAKQVKAKRTSPKRARAVRGALEREPRGTASKTALSRQAKSAARKRSAASRSAAARKASRTKGAQVRSAAAKKAAATRKRRAHR